MKDNISKRLSSFIGYFCFGLGITILVRGNYWIEFILGMTLMFLGSYWIAYQFKGYIWGKNGIHR